MIDCLSNSKFIPNLPLNFDCEPIIKIIVLLYFPRLLYAKVFSSLHYRQSVLRERDLFRTIWQNKNSSIQNALISIQSNLCINKRKSRLWIWLSPSSLTSFREHDCARVTLTWTRKCSFNFGPKLLQMAGLECNPKVSTKIVRILSFVFYCNELACVPFSSTFHSQIPQIRLSNFSQSH